MSHVPEKKVRVHAKPRISANELARFMVAGDVGRTGIIRRAKNASTAVAVRYADARAAISGALCNPIGGSKLVFAARDKFDQKAHDAANTDWTREDCRKSIDVIDSFISMSNQLAGFDFVQPPSAQPYLMMADVSISVNCDVMIHRPVKGVESVGGVLFRLTKPEEDETETAKAKRVQMGRYAATLIYLQVEKNLHGGRVPQHDLCWSLDIQSGERHFAPKNNKTLISSLEAACSFISAYWDRV